MVTKEGCRNLVVPQSVATKHCEAYTISNGVQIECRVYVAMYVDYIVHLNWNYLPMKVFNVLHIKSEKIIAIHSHVKTNYQPLM